MFGSESPAERRRLQPKVSNDLESVVWVENRAQYKTADVVERALDMLIRYYLRASLGPVLLPGEQNQVSLLGPVHRVQGGLPAPESRNGRGPTHGARRRLLQ